MNKKELEERISELEEEVQDLDSQIDDANAEVRERDDEINDLENREFSKGDFNDTFDEELSEAYATKLKVCIGEYNYNKVYIIIE